MICWLSTFTTALVPFQAVPFQGAHVVLLCLGECEDYSGESQSRTQIVVPMAQQRLAEAVAATGRPTVVLLRTGGGGLGGGGGSRVGKSCHGDLAW